MSEYVRQLVADHLIHAWDLAAATGGDRRLDPDLVADVAAWFAEREDLYRQAGLIAEPAGTYDDAQSDLLSRAGRDPGWTPGRSRRWPLSPREPGQREPRRAVERDRGRLRGRRGGRGRDGVHRRADRPRRRHGRAGRPAVRRRAGTGSTRTRSCGCTRRPRSTACPRRCSAAGASSRRVRRRACTSGRPRRRWCAYYDRVLRERMLPSGRVTFHPSSDYVGDGRVVSRVSGQEHQVRDGARVVDAQLSVAARSRRRPRRPFAVADGAHVVPVHELVDLGGAPSQFVIVGLRQDRHRRVRLAARQRCRPGRDLLGAAARPVDAEPRGACSRTRRCSSAWRADTMEAAAARGDARRPVPGPGGARRDAARRPVRDADHGEDPDAGGVGARAAAHDRQRRTPRAPRARGAGPPGAR